MEKIVGKRVKNKKTQYKCRYLFYGPAYDEWVNASDLEIGSDPESSESSDDESESKKVNNKKDRKSVV